MTTYDAAFTGVHVAFEPQEWKNTLGEYLSGLGKTQLHIAETQKYAMSPTSSTAASSSLIPARIACSSIRPGLRPST
jgi:hypothetical protein